MLLNLAQPQQIDSIHVGKCTTSVLYQEHSLMVLSVCAALAVKPGHGIAGICVWKCAKSGDKLGIFHS